MRLRYYLLTGVLSCSLLLSGVILFSYFVKPGDQPTADDQPAAPAGTKPNDRTRAAHQPAEKPPPKKAPAADAPRAERLATLRGYLDAIDREHRRLTIRTGPARGGRTQVLPVADDCAVSINKLRQLDDRAFTLEDLQPGDRLTVEHAADIRRIDAYRVLEASGEVGRVDLKLRRLMVSLRDRPEPVAFSLAPDCEITVWGKDGAVDLDYVRPGDAVVLTHDAIDLKEPVAHGIKVEARPNRRSWAIILGQESYEDPKLARLPGSAADARLLRDAFGDRYRVPRDQILFQIDGSRRPLVEQIGSFLKGVPPEAQLIVYFAGRGFVGPSGAPQLAAADSRPAEIDATGLPLRRLIDEMEKCRAQEKLLLLDCPHTGDGDQTPVERSAAQLVAALPKGPTGAVSTSVIVVADAGDGRQGAGSEDAGQGLFARTAAAAFGGEADANGDYRVDADEFFTYLKAKMGDAGDHVGRRRLPERFLPDATPPRLTEEATDAVRRLLARLRTTLLDEEKLTAEYKDACALAPGEPEPPLAYGLVLLKHGRRADARAVFEEVLLNHAGDALPALHAVAWLDFRQRDFPGGITALVQLVSRLPTPKDGGTPDPYAAHVFHWAGLLRGFAFKTAERDHDRIAGAVKKLDAAVGAHGEKAKELYAAGNAEALDRVARFDRRIAEASGAAAESNLRLARRQVGSYADFDFAAAAARLEKMIEH